MPQGRSLISFKWYLCSLYSPRLLLPAQAKTHPVTLYPSLLLPSEEATQVARASFLIQAEMSYEHKTSRKAPGSVPWWMKRSLWIYVGRSWLCSSLCTEGWYGGGCSPHQVDGQEISGVSRKGCQASRLPVHVSNSNLSYGAAVHTIWFLTFARPGRGFYSNHLFSIIEWWIASLTSSFELPEHFPWLIPPGTTSAIDVN